MRFFLAQLAAKIYYRFFEKNKEADRMGIVALTFDDRFLYHIDKPKLVIAVTGTNGKTTTCHMLNDLFVQAGYQVCFNQDGCNLRPGLSKALILQNSLFNHTKADVAILEFDELSAKDLLAAIKPNYVICTNLSMDTMGRNGHTDYVFQKIQEGLPKDCKLVLNADDLISSQLDNGNERIFFSLAQQDYEPIINQGKSQDLKVCPNCFRALTFDFIRYHHIGKAHCEYCGFTNSKPDVVCQKVDKNHQKMLANNKWYPIVNDSTFNIYNQLAAITLAQQCGLTKIEDTFQSMEIVKSRYEQIQVGSIEIIAQMCKGQNPASLSQAMAYVAALEKTKEVILIIDDVFDKRSNERSEVISYIYDTDYECLNHDLIKRIIIAGVRALDYKVRLLFAKIPEEKIVVFENEMDVLKGLRYDCHRIVIVNDMYQEKTRKQLIEGIKEALEWS